MHPVLGRTEGDMGRCVIEPDLQAVISDISKLLSPRHKGKEVGPIVPIRRVDETVVKEIAWVGRRFTDLAGRAGGAQPSG